MAAGLEARAAATAGEVLLMRADILLDIIAGRIKLLQRARSAAPSRETAAAPGTRRITDMEQLASFLRGSAR